MGNADTPLSRLGRRLAGEEDELVRSRARDPGARERFVDAGLAIGRSRRPHPNPSPGRGSEGRRDSEERGDEGDSRPAARRPAEWAARGAAVLAAIAAGLLLFFLVRRPLTFQVGAGPAASAGVVGAFIATAPDRATPVRFSDGTSLQIQPESTVRVALVDAHGGRVVLENGAVRAAVVHRPGARWLVDSGPFEVRVTGTRFEVRWNPAEEELVVTLEEGSVAVSGPVIGEGFGVRAGQTLSVKRRGAQFELRSDDEGPTLPLPPPVETARPAAGSEDREASPPGDPPASPSASASSPPRALAPRPSWRELTAAGKFREALEVVDREGFRRVCEEGSAADLRDLGDAARLSGDVPRAVVALTALRRRFPRDEQAAQAAFLLGVLAFDQRGAPEEAARWFAAYLSERPDGRLAREAAGRLIEAHEKSGDRAGALEAARRYLRDYPSGPHAEMARAITGG